MQSVLTWAKNTATIVLSGKDDKHFHEVYKNRSSTNNDK